MANDEPNGGGRPNLLDLVDELEPLEPRQRVQRLSELGLPPDLRQQVERCLRFDGHAADFMQRPPAPGLAWASSSFDAASPALHALDAAPAGGSTAGLSTAGLWTQVPGYEVKAKLGEGGMGSVWRAVQLATRREVALKVMGAVWVGSERVKARFDREVQITARLEHPHIARVYDSGVHQGAYFYAMELIDGEPLDHYVESARTSRRQTLDLMRAVCQAVAHAHQNGVIHRDLKPSNILVTRDGQPRVLDFGLAKALEEASSDLTVEGELSGTPAYMSPEQAAGKGGRLDTRSDVYSLGVILYRLLTGRSPHDLSGTRLELLRRVSEQDVTVPRAAGLDRELEAVLLKSLARDRDRRYASAAEFARDLDHYLKGEPVSAKPPTLGYVARKRLRRHWAPVTVAAGVVLALLAMGIWSFARESRHRRVAERNATDAREGQLAALAARRDAELSLAQAKVAEGDALLVADEIGQAQQRYEEARLIQERLGAPTFMTELAQWSAYCKSPPPLMEFVGHTGRINCAAFLPGGRRMVTGGEDGTVRLWDALTGRTLRIFPGVGRVRQLSVSPDGRTVAIAGAGRGLTLWDLETGTQAGEMTGFAGDAVAVAYSPDGKLLLLGTTDRQRNAHLFDAATGRLVRTLEGHRSAVPAVAFSPDGQTAYTSGGRTPGDLTEAMPDVGIRAWSVADGQNLWDSPQSITGNSVARGLAVSPDGKSLIDTGAWGRIRLLDSATGREVASSQFANSVEAVALSSEGALAAVATAGGTVEMLWADARQPVKGYHERTLYFGGERAVCFSPDGRFLAAAAGDVVRLWPVFEAAAQRPLHVGNPFADVGWEAVAVSLSGDGQFVAASGRVEKRAWLLDAGTGLPLGDCQGSRLAPETGEARDEHDVLAAFVPGKDLVLVAEEDGRLELFENLIEKTRVRYLEPWGERRAAGVAASPDGQHALVRFWGTDELQLYDLRNGERLGGLRLEGAATIDRMAFSPDGTLVAACSREGLVRVWEVATRRERRTWRTTRVNCIAFSPDGTLLACAGPKLEVFDVVTGSTPMSLTWPGQLWAVAFMPDGSHLAVGGERGGWAVVDPRTQATRTFGQGGGIVDHCQFSTDGRHLVVAQPSSFGPLHLLDLSFPAVVRSMKSRIASLAPRLASDPEDAQALRALGEWYAFRRVWQHAAELLGRARAAGAAVSALELGRCYWMGGDGERARVEFARAAEAAKARGDAAELRHINLCLRAMSQTPSVPEDPRADPYLWEVSRRAAQPDWAESRKFVDAAMRTLPAYAGRLKAIRAFEDNEQGYLLAEAGRDLEQAKRFTEAAVKAFPENSNYLASLGWVHYKLGKFDEAVAWLDQSVTGADSATAGTILDHLGDALWRAGRTTEAVAAWRRAVQATDSRSSAIVDLVKAKLQAAEQGRHPAAAPTAAEQGAASSGAS